MINHHTTTFIENTTQRLESMAGENSWETIDGRRGHAAVVKWLRRDAPAHVLGQMAAHSRSFQPSFGALVVGIAQYRGVTIPQRHPRRGAGDWA